MAKKKGTSSPPIVHHLPITKVRTNLGAIMKQVHVNKEYVILEKNGMPIAGMMDIDEFEDYLELQDPKIQEHIRKSNAEYQTGKSHPAAEFLAELTPPKGKRTTTTRRRNA